MEAFKVKRGHRDGTLVWWGWCPARRGRHQSSLSCLYTCTKERPGENTARGLQARKGGIAKKWIIRHFNLELCNSENCEIINVCVSYPVYDILLSYHELINMGIPILSASVYMRDDMSCTYMTTGLTVVSFLSPPKMQTSERDVIFRISFLSVTLSFHMFQSFTNFGT